MPYKFEYNKRYIPKHKDKRVKLTEEDKKEILRLYKTGEYSQRKLATMFNVSRRLISIYVDESGERLAKMREQYKERRKDGRYYDKEKNREYMKKHRHYKKELYDKGELEKQ